MWLKARDINTAISKAANIIVDKIDIEELKKDVAYRIAESIRCQIDGRHVQDIHTMIGEKLVVEITNKYRTKILDNMTDEDFTKLIKDALISKLVKL